MKYCNHPHVCEFFDLRKGKCQIANWPVEMVAGGHVAQPQHRYARIKNCFLTRKEAADAQKGGKEIKECSGSD